MFFLVHFSTRVTHVLRQTSQGSEKRKPLNLCSLLASGSLDLKCRLILEWTVITSPPALLLCLVTSWFFRAPETEEHKISHNSSLDAGQNIESVLSIQVFCYPVRSGGGLQDVFSSFCRKKLEKSRTQKQVGDS